MSGIAGVYMLDGRPVDTSTVAPMIDAMEHRGPDDQGIWCDGSVGLGHCMLQATPESLHEEQPLVNRRGDLVLTADARIDNRDELIRILRPPIPEDRPITDAELILAAYDRWGEDCPQKLLGAFAFAIWDSRKKSIFCSLDHFGVRPFYYYYKKGDIFAFASEIKAIFALSGIPRELDEVRIAEHLLVDVEEDVTRTYFNHIRKVAPAHTIVVKPDSISENQYWTLDPGHEIRFSSDEKYAERFKALFEEAVRVRLRSTGPVGSMLSGGLDSSSIVCQAVHLLRDLGSDSSLHTFSAVFDEDSGSDESRYIDAVLERYDELQPHFIQGDERSPIAEWSELQKYVDGACTAGNAYIFWRSLRRAKDHGIRVMLDGFDGDTTLSHGMGFLYQLRHECRLLKLASSARARAKQTGESEWDVVWAWLREPILSLPGISQLVMLRQRLKSLAPGQEDNTSRTRVPKWRRVLSEEMVQRVEPYVTEKGFVPKTDREYHRWQLTRPLMKRILDLWSQMAGAHSIDFRYPFYDKRLVEFCLALPPNHKIRQGWSRLVMRQAMEGILPPKVQWRRGKGDLSMALDTCLANFEQPLLERLSEGAVGEIDGYVSRDFLQESVPGYLAGKIGSGGGGGRDGTIVWRSLSLALWLRHLGRGAPKDDR